MMEARGRRPLLLIDIAVPRDIDPRCGALEGVTLRDIDDLESAVAAATSRAAPPTCRAPRRSSSRRSCASPRWLGQLDVRPTIAALRRRGDEIVERVLDENARRWETASKRDLARIEALARAVDVAPAARADDPPAEPRRRAQPRLDRAAARPVRACAATTARDGEAARRRPGAVRERAPQLRRATRGAHRRAALRLGTRGEPARAAPRRRSSREAIDGEVETVVLRTGGDRGEGERQAPLGRHDRGGAARGARRPRRALREGRARRARGGPASSSARPRAPTRATRSAARRRSQRCAAGARVGTSSLRRGGAAAGAARGSSRWSALHGNLDTRLARLAAGDFDAIVLARGRPGAARPRRLDGARGARAGGRAGDARARGAHRGRARRRRRSPRCATARAERALAAERALVRRLGAGCDTPVGALRARVRRRRSSCAPSSARPTAPTWIRDGRAARTRRARRGGRGAAAALRRGRAARMSGRRRVRRRGTRRPGPAHGARARADRRR